MILIAYGVAMAEGPFHTPAMHADFQSNAENRIPLAATRTPAFQGAFRRLENSSPLVVSIADRAENVVRAGQTSLHVVKDDFERSRMEAYCDNHE